MKSTLHSQISYLLHFTILMLISSTGYSQLSGNVFKDYNSNGQQDTNMEIGVGGILVTAYTTLGSISTSTIANGSYSFSAAQLPAGTPVRLEFTKLNGFFAGVKGSDSNSSVLFVNAGANTNASLGILEPKEYCGLDGPTILTTCYVNGNPLGGGTAGEDIAVVTFPYSASGLAGQNGADSPAYVAKVKEIGSAWGLTYHSSTKQFLVSALVRRHSGLGPLGTGGLYLVDNPTATTTPFMDIQTAPLNITTGANPHVGLPADKTVPNEDSLTIHAVGKTGIGAITLSQDQRTLYLVNLFDRKLYSFEVGVPMAAPTDASTLKSYVLPDPQGRGEHRPWAVTEYRGEIYVGIVNSGEISKDTANLRAYVFKLDEASGSFTEVFSKPLSYKKGPSDASGECVNIDTWQTWSDVFPQGCSQFFDPGQGKVVNFVMNPQPMLSSIHFDSDGSLLLGFMDRFGLFAGYRNFRPQDDGMLYDGFVAGDLLRAQFNPENNTFILENNGKSGVLTGSGVGNGEGPGGGEFFGDDVWRYLGEPAHNEITNGGILVFPGKGEIIVSAMDPVDEIFQSGGVRTFRNTDGKMLRGFALYSDVPGTLGKSGGVGELKMACDAAAIEIGNRIWHDKNFNGVQDPDEAGVDDVTVKLFDMDNNGAEIGSVQTQKGGIYCFNLTNTPALDYYKNYEIRLDFSQNGLGQQFEKLSTKHNDPSENGDERDSDGELIGETVVIKINSGFPGQTAHKYDVGLIKCEKPDAGNDLSFCAPLHSIKLADAALGQKWRFASGPVTAQIDSLTGRASGMTVAGEYEFALVFEPAGSSCSDTVSVTVKPLPNGGEDFLNNQANCIADGKFKLTAITTNGKWDVAAGNPTQTTIDTEGNISGLSVEGIYAFIYEVDQCVDTVKVQMKDCNIGQIGNLVWSDTNDNGIQDDNNSAVKGITVEIYKLDNQGNTELTPFKTTSTGDNGEYLFDRLPSGSYKVKFNITTLPSDTEFSKKKGIGMAEEDSDVYFDTGLTDAIIIDNNNPNSNVRLDIDAAIRPSCIKPNAGQDFAFCAPQTTYSLSTPISGQAWRFIGGPKNVDLNNATGQVNAMDADGKYVFALEQSNIGNTCADTVEITRSTKPNAGNDLIGNDAVCTTDGTAKLNAMPTGGAWTAMDNNPTAATINQEGNITGMSLAGNYNFIYSIKGCSDTVMVAATVCQIPCIKPNAGQDFAFCAPQATYSLNTPISGQAWRFISGPNNVDLNTATGQVNAMDADGKYIFVLEQSNIGSTCADTVEITRNTKPNAGNDLIGNDAVCISNGTITLGATPVNGMWSVAAGNPISTTIDNSGKVSGMTTMGFYQFVYTINGCSDTVKVEAIICNFGKIGARVWIDANDNGIQDNDERGVSDVKLQLYKVNNSGDQIGDFVADITTNLRGGYLFDNLDYGQYKVKIILASIPPNFVVSSKTGVGADREVDSDFYKETLSSNIITVDRNSRIHLHIDAALIDICTANICLPVTIKKVRN